MLMKDIGELKRLVDEEESNEEDEEITFRPTRIKRTKSCPYLGIIFAAISSVFFSLVSVIVKYLVNVHPIQLTMCRFTGIFLPAVPILIWRNESAFPKGKRLMLIFRTFSGTTGLMLNFYAFRHMPLGDASVLIFSFPVFVAIFARLFLKEPYGPFHVITISLTLFGIILISKSPFIFGSSISAVGSHQQSAEINLLGPVAAFTAALFAANDIILMRALKGIHFSVIMVNYGASACTVCLITTWGLDVLCWPQCGTERLLTVAVAFLSFGGQIFLIVALQFEQAGPVSIARSSDIVFAFIWQIAFFQEVPNLYSIAGACLVTSSVFLSGIRTWVLSLPETSMIRNTFRIFEM